MAVIDLTDMAFFFFLHRKDVIQSAKRLDILLSDEVLT